MSLTFRPKSQIDEEELNKNLLIEESTLIKYLNETDWYMIRFNETGKDIPIDVKNQRDAARLRISEIRLIINQ